jgi:hypothetical protein
VTLVRLGRRAATALALLIAPVACGGAPGQNDRLGLPLHRPVTRAELQALRYASLAYPGSRLLRRVGSDQRGQPNSPDADPAFAGMLAAAPAAPPALLAWYDRQLRADGGVPAAYYRGSDRVAGAAWTLRGTRDQVQVAVFRAGSHPTGPVPTGWVTYEALFVAYRVAGPPPP